MLLVIFFFLYNILHSIYLSSWGPKLCDIALWYTYLFEWPALEKILPSQMRERPHVINQITCTQGISFPFPPFIHQFMFAKIANTFFYRVPFQHKLLRMAEKSSYTMYAWAKNVISKIFLSGCKTTLSDRLKFLEISFFSSTHRRKGL